MKQEFNPQLLRVTYELSNRMHIQNHRNRVFFFFLLRITKKTN